MKQQDRQLNRPTPEEDQQIKQMITADADDFEATADDFAQFQPLTKMGRPKAAIKKESVTIRLSPEVVGYFRASGKGWQTRLEQALKDYMQSHP